ncbi:2066_t:CDS:2 [Funneliformis geosporum]|uniref:2066_t:CDS:1 n=1 Tax=Funneliformis geosporum TaxID=1117311 RepID=A0A9W4SA54_9GLOM|nr:2066_t:CDS:2 [Funneliformis geosporum]
MDIADIYEKRIKTYAQGIPYADINDKSTNSSLDYSQVNKESMLSYSLDDVVFILSYNRVNVESKIKLE